MSVSINPIKYRQTLLSRCTGTTYAGGKKLAKSAPCMIVYIIKPRQIHSEASDNFSFLGVESLVIVHPAITTYQTG